MRPPAHHTERGSHAFHARSRLTEDGMPCCPSPTTSVPCTLNLLYTRPCIHTQKQPERVPTQLIKALINSPLVPTTNKISFSVHARIFPPTSAHAENRKQKTENRTQKTRPSVSLWPRTRKKIYIQMGFLIFSCRPPHKKKGYKKRQSPSSDQTKRKEARGISSIFFFPLAMPYTNKRCGCLDEPRVIGTAHISSAARLLRIIQ